MIDAFARRIVGWRVNRTANAGVVLDALEQAVHQRQPGAGLARWLYRQLQAECDYLTSDEAIEEGIIVNAYTVTEEGRRFGGARYFRSAFPTELLICTSMWRT